MCNILAYNKNGRTLRLIWFVTKGKRPELRSFWSIQDSLDIVEGGSRGPIEDRNQPVTMPCDTEAIVACA